MSHEPPPSEPDEEEFESLLAIGMAQGLPPDEVEALAWEVMVSSLLAARGVADRRAWLEGAMRVASRQGVAVRDLKSHLR